MQFWHIVLHGCILAIAASSCGCATHANRLRNPRASFYAGKLDTANSQFDKLLEKPKGDASVVELELAMTELFQGDIASAEQRLRAVRDRWDAVERQSLTEKTASYVVDDRVRAYAGEDYEKILVRVWLTLCSLMKDGVDAESYSLQTLAKQQDLLQGAEQRTIAPELSTDYCIPAIAPYLRATMLEASLRNYAEAAKFYGQAAKLNPSVPFLAEDLQRVETGVHSQPGHGVVYVIALVGRGPYKSEQIAPVTQSILQAADLIVSQVGEYTVPPTLAPVKVPRIESSPKPFDLIGVEINGTPISTTLPISDLHQLAADTYATKLPDVVLRSAVRRIIKKGAVYAAKDELEVSSDITNLALDAAGVLWEASESADTRCWGLLPREIQVLRLELPQGEHYLHLEPIVGGSPVAAGIDAAVPVQDASNTYVLSYWPDLQPVGQVLVSAPH